jgi:methylated-DNA-[protein]-cysteine S-methyltransferase
MAKRQDYDAVIAAPFGRLGIRLTHGRLADIDFLDSKTRPRAPKDAPARRVCRELGAYLHNPKHRFRLPLAQGGTDFQQRVWRALQRIPVGKVLSYGALARRLKTGPRAVGNACRANPIPVVVPCHRVVAANGKGGFMGKTGGMALVIKDWLLAHERGR